MSYIATLKCLVSASLCFSVAGYRHIPKYTHKEHSYTCLPSSRKKDIYKEHSFMPHFATLTCLVSAALWFSVAVRLCAEIYDQSFISYYGTQVYWLRGCFSVDVRLCLETYIAQLYTTLQRPNVITLQCGITLSTYALKHTQSYRSL